MGKTKKNIAWLIITICFYIIFVPIIVFNTILSVKAMTNPEQLPSVFDISPTSVISGSMSPEFEKNDLIFLKAVDANTLEVNDVICYNKDGGFTTHRIERIEVVDGVKHFYTKGDANNTVDSGYVLAEQIQGKYVYKITGLGGVIMFLQDPYGLMLTVILLLMLYIAGELLIEWRAKHKENAKLVEENLTLKAQLEVYAQAATTATQTEQTPVVPQEVVSEQIEQAVAPDKEEEEEPPLVQEGEQGLNIQFKYRRSFTSRLIQSGETAQELYSKIKNYLLKYSGVKARMSWSGETFSYKRQVIAKLCIKGKTLYAYLALTDSEIQTLKIDQREEASKYQDVPAKIKVTGVIKLNRTLLAVDVICQRLELIAGDMPSEVYSYPYQTDKQLLDKGLIKLVKSSYAPFEAQTVAQAQEEKEEPKALEANEGEEGLNIQYKYRRSFISRLIQSGEDVQDIYTSLKNYLLKYDGVKARNSWGAETFSHKRQVIAKICIKGKTLYIYLALSQEQMIDLKIDQMVEDRKYQDVPAKIKVTGIIKLNRAMKAIDEICQSLELIAQDMPKEVYSYPYQTDEKLIEQGLIKLVKSDYTPPKQ